MAVNILTEIVDLLKDTFLVNSKVIELKIPESEDLAFAIQINPDNGIESWDLMYSCLAKTGRYPVIVEGSPFPKPLEDWEQSMRRSDFFRRYGYKEENHENKQNYSTDPQSIIERSISFDVDRYIKLEDDNFYLEQFNAEEIEDVLTYQIDSIEERYGKAPKLEEVLSEFGLNIKDIGTNITGEDIHEVKLDRYMFEWELANVDREKVIAYEGIIYERDWFGSSQYYEYSHYAIILLPTKNSWESLAYLHWTGSILPGSDCAIAFLKRWHDRYEAKLVCHFWTVLNLNVGKLPQNPTEAFDLAVEQFTLSDYAMRHNFNLIDYALYLMKVDHWYFHNK